MSGIFAHWIIKDFEMIGGELDRYVRLFVDMHGKGFDIVYYAL